MYLLVTDSLGFRQCYFDTLQELSKLAWLFLVSGLMVEVRG